MGKPLEFPGGLAWTPREVVDARFVDCAGEEPAAVAGPLSLDGLLEMGVGADRAASPDVRWQLRRVDESMTLVCNLVDHEPGMCVNTVLGGQYAKEVARGMEYCAKLVRHVRVAANASAAGRLGELVRLSSPLRAIWAWLPERYPRGHASLVSYALLGKRLKPGACPTSVGALVLDAAALWEIGRALEGRRVDRVPVAAREAGGEARYVLAGVNWSVGRLVDEKALRVYRGDLAARQEVSIEQVIGHGENRFHLAELVRIAPAACARCGWCVQYCPTGVQPAMLLEAAQQRDKPLAEEGGLGSCIECGVCEHVCPSRLPLMAAIRTLKEHGKRIER